MELKLLARRKLILILLLYLFLAIAYSVLVPIGRGADEWAHYWYAQFIADHGRLPANPAEREAAGYKSDWPPLYHLAAATVTGWIETDGPPTFKYRADNIRRQLVPAQGPEAILHTEDELFPWRQEILVWHLGRLLSIIFSAGTLVVTYFVALEVFEGSRVVGSQGRRVASSKVGGSKAARNTEHGTRNTTNNLRFTIYDLRLSPHILALTSTAILAFNPRFLFTGMLFNYDSLTLLLASLFLWLAIRVVNGYYSRWGFWALGALAGLALLTKYLTVLLPLVIVLVAGSRVAGGKVAESQVAKEQTPGSTFHALRSTLYALRLRQFWLWVGQAGLAYLLVVSWWFAYLIINFNEVDKYGPVLGTLAPLIRGDASDRTVEQIFAWLSEGQAPPLAYVEKQSYTAWQLLTEFLATFWGNPITQPYPLMGWVWLMTLLGLAAVIGLIIYLRLQPSQHSDAVQNAGSVNKTRFSIYDFLARYSPPISVKVLAILLLYCLLPIPFMVVRLFGARDALEAVQGRHILFLAGPAVAILLVLGLNTITMRVSWWVVDTKEQGHSVAGRSALHSSLLVPRSSLYVLLALLLAGALSQLLFMWQTYPPPVPVRTTALDLPLNQLPAAVTLPGGGKLIHYSLLPTPYSLKVSLYWQGGQQFAPEDYQIELALVDSQGQTVSSWRAYQTQAHYPTRAWEPGDIIRDDGWLPLTGLPAGNYEIRLRILGQNQTIIDWQPLTKWGLESGDKKIGDWVLWRNGQPTRRQPALRERETVQLTVSPLLSSTVASLHLTGPNGTTYEPASGGSTWANFIIGPDWPAGDYTISEETAPLLQVVASERNFEIPSISQPLSVNFGSKIKLLGYELPSRRVQPGSGLPITLYWQGLEWLGEEFVIFTRLLDNRQVARGGYDRLARENYSTLLWAPGEIITDGFAAPVEPDAPDGVYYLSLGWYRQIDGQAQSLPIIDPETGQPSDVSAVMVGPVKVGGPPAGVTVEQAEPDNPVHVSLGDQIELLGFDLTQESGGQSDDSLNLPNSPNSLNLTFYWQALRQPDADYTAFVHVRDEAGEIVAQKDQPPLGGAYPTDLWDAGEIIKDELSVSLAGIGPGRYELVVGLYDFASGQRLPVKGSGEGMVELQVVEVGERDITGE